MSLLLLLACADVGIGTLTITRSAEADVDGATVLDEILDTLGFSAFTEMDIADAEELENQGVEPGDLVSAKLTAFSLATDTDGADLTFIDAMTVSVTAPDLDDVEVAAQDRFSGTAVDFDVSGAELLDYVLSASLTVLTDVTAEAPPEDTHLRADVAITVEYTLQGAAKAAEGG